MDNLDYWRINYSTKWRIIKREKKEGVRVDEEFNYLNDSKKQFEKIKKISGELRDYVEKEFPEISENDIDFLVKLLGMELKHLFLNL